MLEHTIDRALDVVEPWRIVTVVNDDHRRFLEEPRRLEIPGRIIEQPRRCDTGPGVYLPLTAVMSEDPGPWSPSCPQIISSIRRERALLEDAYHLADELPEQITLAARPSPRSRLRLDLATPLPGRGACSSAVQGSRAPRRRPHTGAACVYDDLVGSVSALWGMGRLWRR